jgi:hypothetical protein
MDGGMPAAFGLWVAYYMPFQKTISTAEELTDSYINTSPVVPGLGLAARCLIIMNFFHLLSE